MSALSGEVPQDWYRRAFDGDTAEVPWTERAVSEVDRVLRILRPEGGERILDLACGSGRHSLELAQRGFSVVGVDISAELIEIANSESKDQGLDVAFLRADIRELAFDPLFDAEYDIVLNLNDGAVGYLESDEENERIFEAISRCLRPGGRNLVQIPNVLYACEHLPEHTWIPTETMVELVERRWSRRDNYIEGVKIPIRFGEVLDGLKEIAFRQRLYTVEELMEIYASVGMEVTGVFDGSGKQGEPSVAQFEIFVESRKARRQATPTQAAG